MLSVSLTLCSDYLLCHSKVFFNVFAPLEILDLGVPSGVYLQLYDYLASDLKRYVLNELKGEKPSDK